jgi:hypothetical protein
MKDLIRHRQERIRKDVTYLEKATAVAPLGDPSKEEMAEIVKTQHRIREERKQRALIGRPPKD